MSLAFAGLRPPLLNPQLALWATDMPPATPAEMYKLQSAPDGARCAAKTARANSGSRHWEIRDRRGRLSYFFIPPITDSHFPLRAIRPLIVDVNTKQQPAEKPAAAPDKPTAKAVGAAAGAGTAVRAPHGQVGAPKREYPTLGYE
jgi:hypothetical protein